MGDLRVGLLLHFLCLVGLQQVGPGPAKVAPEAEEEDRLRQA